MSTPLDALKKSGTLNLPNGGSLTKKGKHAIYRGVQPIEVPLELAANLVESTMCDRPLIVFLEAQTGLKHTEVAQRVALLTPRELQVFQEMGMGSKNKDIAVRFGISQKTLDIHRAMIARKLEIKSANAFGRYFWMFKLVDALFPQILEEARSLAKMT